MKESKQVREWKKPWPYWNQRQNFHWDPGFHLTCLEFFRGIQEDCKAPIRFLSVKSTKLRGEVSSTPRPSHNESTDLHSESGPCFSQVPPFLPQDGSLKSNTLCVCDKFPGFCGCSWKFCSGKQLWFGCFTTFRLVWETWATHLDKLMNGSWTKHEKDLRLRFCWGGFLSVQK